MRLFRISRETAFILAMVCSTLFYTRLVLDYTLVPRFIFLSLSLLALLFWRLKRNSFTIRVDILLFSYVAYIIFTCSSLFWACNASETLFESSKLVLGFGVFMIAVLLLSSKTSVFERIGKASLVLLAISLWVAISQLIVMKGGDKESLYHITGISSHKNLFSVFLFLNLLFCLASAVHFSKGLRIIFIIASFANLCLIAWLQTRAVWLGFMASIIVFAVLMFGRKPRRFVLKKTSFYLAWVGSVLLIIGLFVFGFPRVIDKLIGVIPNPSQQASILDTSTGIERLMVWNKTFCMVKEHPALGVGAGNWQIYFPNSTLTGLWRVEDLNVTFQRPHNDFLWILSETGILGFALYLSFVVGLLLFSIKTFFMLDNARQRLIHGLFVSFMAGFMVLSFFDFPKERIEHTIWINLVYAILYTKIRDNLDIMTLFKVRWKPWVTVFPLLLLLFIASIGFLRFRGEYNTKKMYDLRAKQDWKDVKVACDNAYSFAYTIDPVSMPIHWYRGNANASLRNFSGSLNDLGVAYMKHPYNRNVLNDLGSAYVMNGNPDKALGYYEEAARISPRFDDPKLNLVALYINKGNWGKASFWERSILHDSERRNYYRTMLYKGE